MSQPADLAAALDQARAAEREYRDQRTRDQHDQIDRISRALAQAQHLSPQRDTPADTATT